MTSAAKHLLSAAKEARVSAANFIEIAEREEKQAAFHRGRAAEQLTFAQDCEGALAQLGVALEDAA